MEEIVKVAAIIGEAFSLKQLQFIYKPDSSNYDLSLLLEELSDSNLIELIHQTDSDHIYRFT